MSKGNKHERGPLTPREARRKQTGEIFTPHKLVNEMLAKLPPDAWIEGKTVLDPAVGDGQFLVWILLKKLTLGHDPLGAIQSVYGVDIMRDNIIECRQRLLGVVSGFTEVTDEMKTAVNTNIFWTDQRKYPKGALDYDFSFSEVQDFD